MMVITLLTAPHATMTVITRRSLHHCRGLLLYPVVSHVVGSLAAAALAVLDQ